MNFTTFTGSSRRPRNVNLSGQPSNPNPFASSSSSWNRPGDPARTVAQAQADREQRQRERQRLQSAKTLQRVYRGSLSRERVRDLHRARFDDAYTASPMTGVEADAAERVNRALPHIIRAFRLRNRQDVDRLSRFCHDLEIAGLAALHTQTSLRKIQFLDDLLNVLDMMQRTDTLPEEPTYLRIVTAVVREFSGDVLVAKMATRLFSVLGQLLSGPALTRPWVDAAVAAAQAPFEALSTYNGKFGAMLTRRWG